MSSGGAFGNDSPLRRTARHQGPRSITQSAAEHDIEIVLDDDDGRAAIDQRMERRDDVCRVFPVQAGARLVDDEQSALRRFAERARELQSLRLATRQRRERLAERQVAEAKPARSALTREPSPRRL